MRKHFLLLTLLLSACRDHLTGCPSTPARWEITPDPISISISVGGAVRLKVVEFTCADTRREEVFPTMVSTDSTVVGVSTTHRLVYGFQAGTANIYLLAPNLYDLHADTTVVSVTVR